MPDWKENIRNRERYKDFAIIEEPEPFNKMFAGMDFPLVQVHSARPCGDNDIVGFCGAFKWEGASTPPLCFPLDGDSYYPNMLVLGYNWFTDKDGSRCLDILVGDDW